MLPLKAGEDNERMEEDDEGEDMSKFLSKLFDFLLKVSRWCILKINRVLTKILVPLANLSELLKKLKISYFNSEM